MNLKPKFSIWICYFSVVWICFCAKLLICNLRVLMWLLRGILDWLSLPISSLMHKNTHWGLTPKLLRVPWPSAIVLTLLLPPAFLWHWRIAMSLMSGKWCSCFLQLQLKTFGRTPVFQNALTTLDLASIWSCRHSGQRLGDVSPTLHHGNPIHKAHLDNMRLHSKQAPRNHSLSFAQNTFCWNDILTLQVGQSTTLTKAPKSAKSAKSANQQNHQISKENKISKISKINRKQKNLQIQQKNEQIEISKLNESGNKIVKSVKIHWIQSKTYKKLKKREKTWPSNSVEFRRAPSFLYVEFRRISSNFLGVKFLQQIIKKGNAFCDFMIQIGFHAAVLLFFSAQGLFSIMKKAALAKAEQAAQEAMALLSNRLGSPAAKEACTPFCWFANWICWFADLLIRWFADFADFENLIWLIRWLAGRFCWFT